MNIASLWQLCLHFEYDSEELVLGIEKLLNENKRLRILDCACGTGFPSMQLIQDGYDVTCTDGSPQMLLEFRRNAAAAGIEVTPRCIQWSQLSKHCAHEFDVVMCRGCSLIYAGTWDDHGHPDPSAIRDAVRNFAACLKPDGLLYVDTTSEVNLNRTEPERNIYPERIIGERHVSLSEVVYTNKNQRLRTWVSRLTIDGEAYDFERHSYFLPHDELIEILSECGFGNIQRTKIEGEHYDVFTARFQGPAGP